MGRVRRLGARIAPFAVGLALVLTLAGLRLWDPTPVEVLRLKVFDVFQQIQPRAGPDDADGGAGSQVVIVDVDEESLDAVGQWPWPRSTIAALVARLEAGGALAIGFDVLFAEPDRMSPDRLADRIEAYDKALAQQLRFLPGNDATLAQSFRRHGRVVVAQAVHPRALPHDLGPVNVPSVALLGPDPGARLVDAPGVIRPLPQLADAAAGVGMISLWESPDNVVRRVPLVLRAGGELYPALTMELLRVALGERTYVVESDSAGVAALLIGRYRVPTDASGQIWVHYRPSAAAQYVSAGAVIAGDVAPGTFRDKFVLVGTSATGLGDIKATPLDPSRPGVEVHAQALETVLAGQVLSRPAIAETLEIAGTLALGLALVGLVPLVGAWPALLLGGVLAAATLGVTGWAFFQQRLLLDPGFPLATGFLAFTAMVFSNYLGAEREKRFIRGAFNQYLTPALVDRLAREPEMLQLGGETRAVTVLFSDIRGFTGIAERFGEDARGLTALVNRLLTPLSDQVLAHKGTIDKYIGDAIMAFWNAPVDDPRHADHACRAALAMVAALQALNKEMAAEAAGAEAHHAEAPVVLRAGIGLNSGRCLAGNLGTHKRFNYSVLGDPVNVAARLEALTRTYDVDIILGEATVSALDGCYALLELDLIQVKGRQRPARIFALLGGAALADDPAFIVFAAAHAAMVSAAHGGDPATATRVIAQQRQAAERFGMAAVYDLYADRLAAAPAGPARQRA